MWKNAQSCVLLISIKTSRSKVRSHNNNVGYRPYITPNQHYFFFQKTNKSFSISRGNLGSITANRYYIKRYESLSDKRTTLLRNDATQRDRAL